MAEISNGLPLFPGESDVDQLFQIMRCFGNLTPRMAELVRRNPLFTGVKLPEISEPEHLEKRLPTLDPLALDVIRQCLRYEPLQVSRRARACARACACTHTRLTNRSAPQTAHYLHGGPAASLLRGH